MRYRSTPTHSMRSGANLIAPSSKEQIRSNNGTETWLAQLAGSLLIVYVLSSPFLLVGSLQVGDVCLFLAVPLLLLSRHAQSSLIRFFRCGYSFLVLWISIWMMVATFFTPSMFENLKSIAQLEVVFWLLIPIVAVGVAEMRSPLRFLQVGAWASVITFVLGTFLLFSFGVNWIVSRAADNRLFGVFNFGAFAFAALPLAVVYVFNVRPLRWHHWALLFGAMVPILLNNSRTGMVNVALVILLGAIGVRRTWFGVGVGLVAVSLTLGLLFSGALQSFLGLERSVQFFSDPARIEALSAAIQTLGRGKLAVWLFGVGWGNSGFVTGDNFRVLVHNLPIEVIEQAGILTAMGLGVLLVLPLFWWVKCKRADALERNFALLSFASLVVTWAFQPISYERIYWLPFAVTLGMARRLSLSNRINPLERAELDGRIGRAAQK